ncbi:MAG: DM13 domain-containing protein [Verrucomicrobiales bacterium]|nr:DM13 domain-containing protein [Verrucomicrobiales bacterium]
MKIIITLAVLFIASFASIDRVLADEVITSGTFVGKSDHVTKGGASIEQDADGNYIVVLGEDFSLDGAPDPKVGLGKDGYKKNAELGKLEKKKGKQVYSIPANFDPADFNEIWIWCERFSVPLGVAKLS